MRKTLLAALAGSSISTIVAVAPAIAQDTQQSTTPAPQSAQAPRPVAAPAPDDDEEEIVITGTQIRGTTPAGSTLLTTTAVQAEEQGATNGNEILSQLPQASNFFQQLPSLAGLGGAQTAGLVAVSRLPSQGVTLRALPNVNVGGSPTLILIDSHRVVPTGTNVLGGQNVDNSTISAATLLRTEIMPDGGSAIYGSDAVTGVINYITRDDFDGVEVQLRGGFAGDYYTQYDGSITAGTKWSSGSVYGSFAYSWHDALLGKDKDYLTSIDRNPNSPLYLTPLGLNCIDPNISLTSVVNGINSRRLYPLTGPGGQIQSFTTNGGTNGSGSSTTTNGVAGGNRCNGTDFSSYYPEEKRYNANFGLTQNITDSLVFRLKGTWQKRESETSQGISFSPTVCGTQVAAGCPQVGTTGRGTQNPFYRNVSEAGAGNFFAPDALFVGTGLTGTGSNGCGVGLTCTPNQTILTDMQATSVGDHVPSFVALKSWQITPSLTWDIGSDWQIRGLVSYGQSDTQGIQGAFDSVTAQSRVNLGQINPYNLPASAAGAFDNLFTFSTQIGEYKLFDARVIADGPVFTLPGGEVRVAIGAEYLKTKLAQNATGTVLSNTPDNFILVNPVDGSGDPLRYTQSDKAVFAETQIPLVSEEMDVPLIHSLRISASARYDKYNDFGDTFNPMIGATWEPASWISIRGNWNTSFAAPTNMTMLGTVSGAQANNGGGNCNGPTGALCLNGGAGGGVIPYFRGFFPPGDINGGLPLPQGGTALALGAKNEITPTGLVLSLTNGTSADVGPQESETFSLGFEISPPQAPGLTFGASYYDLTITGTIASPFAPAVQSAFDFHPEVIYCHGGVIGNAANAPAACAVPMTLAELDAGGFLVPITAGGLALPSSLTSAGTAGTASGSSLPWSTVRANYCDPSVYTAGAGGGANCPAGSYTVFYVADNRQRNLGFVYSRGIDFNASYRTNTSWGSIDMRLNGTVNLETSTRTAKGFDKSNIQAFDTSVWRIAANLGTTWEGLRAQITWQHSAGYDITPSGFGTVGTATVPGTGAFGQTHIEPFNTFDLFFRYDFNSMADKSSLFKELSLTLNITNIFNNDPPIRGGGFANGLTLGRLFQFGLTKRFN